MIAIEGHLAKEIAGYLRRVQPQGHEEADRIYEIVHILESEASHAH